jgi:chloramphenicol O-acetyltransferase type B
MFRFILAKIIKKLRLAAIADSKIHYQSKIEAGSTIVRSTFDRQSFCGYDCSIADADVGAFTSIGNSVFIGGASHPNISTFRSTRRTSAPMFGSAMVFS